MRWGFIAALLIVGTIEAQRSRGSVSGSCWRAIEKVSKSGVETTFLAIDVETGEVVATHAASTGLIPASVQKVMTAAGGLLGLGPDHAIYTDLLTHGKLEDGVFRGVLRLRGEGDPTLESETILPALVGRVKRAGIRRIEGDLLVDDRLFDRAFTGRQWPKDRPSRRHMAEVAALSLDHGTVRVQVTGAKRGGHPAHVRILPAGAVSARGTVMTVRKKQRPVIWAERGRSEDGLRTGGSVTAGTTGAVSVAVHDPAIVFGRALHRALRDAGIVVTGAVRRPADGEYARGGHLVARVKTRLKDVLPVLLENSQNHRAEMLFKHVGAALAGAGTFDAGDRAIRSVLRKVGVDLDGAILADGSGLSYANRVSARQLAATLRAVWRSKSRSIFVDALAHGGEAGTTMRRRLTSLGRRVSAKTGTLSRAKGLAGFVETQGGRTLAFAVIMNSKKPGKNAVMRAAQNTIVLALSRLGPRS